MAWHRMAAHLHTRRRRRCRCWCRPRSHFTTQSSYCTCTIPSMTREKEVSARVGYPAYHGIRVYPLCFSSPHHPILQRYRPRLLCCLSFLSSLFSRASVGILWMLAGVVARCCGGWGVVCRGRIECSVLCFCLGLVEKRRAERVCWWWGGQRTGHAMALIRETM